MAVDPYASPPPTRRDFNTPPGAPVRGPRLADYCPPGSPTQLPPPVMHQVPASPITQYNIQPLQTEGEARMAALARAVLSGQGRTYITDSVPHCPMR